MREDLSGFLGRKLSLDLLLMLPTLTFRICQLFKQKLARGT
jgi:hypothetical protein